ncbi:MAG TPA: NADH-quinone oxidoreductase subunit J [Lutibacter sp.]|nr:NADH-quinone oxidoreductase subunit J [Lutibacter sp.]
MEQIIFYIFAIIIIVMALASVTSRMILRAVIYLLLSLLAISAIYFMLEYNFLGAVQLAVYAGGIIILFIFAVFLVHQIDGKLEVPSIGRKIFMAALSAVGLAITLTTIYSHDFKVVEATKAFDVKDIGRGLLGTGEGGFILPFEVISVLLLAAMIGAIIIAKGQKIEVKK